MPIRPWPDPDHNVTSENDVWDLVDKIEQYKHVDKQSTHRWKAGHAFDYLLYKQSKYGITLTDF